MQLVSIRERLQTNFYHMTVYHVTASQHPSAALHHLLNKTENLHHGQRFLECGLTLSIQNCCVGHFFTVEAFWSDCTSQRSLNMLSAFQHLFLDSCHSLPRNIIPPINQQLGGKRGYFFHENFSWFKNKEWSFPSLNYCVTYTCLMTHRHTSLNNSTIW